MDRLAQKSHQALGIGPESTYSLRLVSKKLNSGRCQVKFFAKLPGKGSLYGYVLAEAHDTLKGVVEGILTKLRNIGSHADFRHRHLYSIQKMDNLTNDIIIFDT